MHRWCMMNKTMELKNWARQRTGELPRATPAACVREPEPDRGRDRRPRRGPRRALALVFRFRLSASRVGESQRKTQLASRAAGGCAASVPRTGCMFMYCMRNTVHHRRQSTIYIAYMIQPNEERERLYRIYCIYHVSYIAILYIQYSYTAYTRRRHASRRGRRRRCGAFFLALGPLGQTDHDCARRDPHHAGCAHMP